MIIGHTKLSWASSVYVEVSLGTIQSSPIQIFLHIDMCYPNSTKNASFKSLNGMYKLRGCYWYRLFGSWSILCVVFYLYLNAIEFMDTKHNSRNMKGTLNIDE